jgi:hypothetical protein
MKSHQGPWIVRRFRPTPIIATLALSLAACDITGPSKLPVGDVILVEMGNAAGSHWVEVRELASGKRIHTGPVNSAEPTLHRGAVIYTMLGPERREIVSTDIRMRSSKALTPRGVSQYAARFSHSGERIVFVEEGPDGVVIKTSRPDGSGATLLPESTRARVASSPAWLVTGQIVFEGEHNGQGAILRTNNELEPVVLYAPGHPVFQPSGSPDGRSIAVVSARAGVTWAERYDTERRVGYRIAGTAGAIAVGWTPDSEMLIAIRDGDRTAIHAWRVGDPSSRLLYHLDGHVLRLEAGRSR